MLLVTKVNIKFFKGFILIQHSVKNKKGVLPALLSDSTAQTSGYISA